MNATHKFKFIPMMQTGFSSVASALRQLAILTIFVVANGITPSISNAFDWNRQDYEWKSGDYNSDGLQDLFVTVDKRWLMLHGSITIPIPLFEDQYVLLAQADGSYHVLVVQESDLSTLNLTPFANQIAKGDFNADGTLDVLVQSSSGVDYSTLIYGDSTNDIVVSQYLDDKSLGFPISGNINIELVDFNNDGFEDVLTHSDNGVKRVAYGTSSGFAQAPPLSSTGVFNSTLPSNPNSFSQGIGAIASTFNVSSVGKPQYRIPISLPPSVRDLAPDISLVYSGQDSNGPVGVGWYLDGVTEIDRCQSTLVQDGFNAAVNFRASDRFCINGRRLVAINGNYGADGTEYRTEIESFTKIVSYGNTNNGPAYFKVWKSSGEIETYGNTVDSRRTNSARNRVVAWMINRLEDREGNAVTYSYNNEAASGRQDIAAIQFGNNKVTFEYENRNDRWRAYPNGAYKSFQVRLDKIKTYVGTNEARSYDLEYEYGSSTGRSRLNRVTECVRGVHCLPTTTFSWEPEQGGLGYSNVANSIDGQRYPTGINYERQQYHVGDVNADGATDLVWTYRNTNTLGWALYLANKNTGKLEYVSRGQETGYLVNDLGDDTHHQFMMGDVNGDGKSDLIWVGRYLSDVYRVTYLANSQGNGFNAQGYQVDSSQSFSDYKEGQYQLADVNGDGRQDIVFTFIDQNRMGRIVYLAVEDAQGDVGFGRARVAYDDDYSPLFYTHQNVTTGDVNGDNKADLLWTFAYLNKFYRVLYLANTMGDGFYKVSLEDDVPASNMDLVEDLQLHLADTNSDSKADIVLTFSYNNNLVRRTYLSAEIGTHFDLSDSAVESIFDPNQYDEPRSQMADLNKDGMSDMLYTYRQSGNVFIVPFITNAFGTGFDRQTTQSLSHNSSDAFFENQHYLSGDVNADGRTDLIWAYNGVSSHDLYQRVYTLPTAHPDHIASIVDGLGNEIKIDYDYLSRANSNVYQSSGVQNYPVRTDIGRSFVVKQIEQSNGIGGFNRWTYRYENARTHLRGRGFLGFEKQIVTDHQTNFVTNNRFQQSFPFIGSLLSSETFLDGQPIELNYQHWQNLATTWNTVTTDYPVLKDTATVKYNLRDGQSDGQATAALTINQYDSTSGNLIEQTTLTGTGFDASVILASYNDALPFTEPNLLNLQLKSKRTHQFDDNFNTWRLGFLENQTIEYSAPGEETRTVINTYTPKSNNSHLVKSQTLFSGSDGWVTEVYEHDAYGNVDVINRTAYQGDAQSDDFDFTTDGLFVEFITNSLNQTENYTHDQYNGSQRSVEDVNDLVSYRLKDDFGRTVYERYPDGTEKTLTYTADSSVPYAKFKVTQVVSNPLESDAGAPELVIYFDSLGREIQRKQRGFDGQWIVQKTAFDSRGRVQQQSQPYFEGDTVHWATYVYDDLDRILEENRPDGGQTKTAYDVQGNYGPREVVVQTIVGPDVPNRTIETHRHIDALGLLREVNDDVHGLNIRTQLAYDTQGNQRWSRVDNNSNTDVVSVFNVAGHRTSLIDPDAGTIISDFDGYGNLIEALHGTGNDQVSVVTDYDAINRIKTRTDTYRDQSGQTQVDVSQWIYDTAPNGIGLLAEMSGPDFLETYTYDILSRESVVSTQIMDQPERVKQTTYDGYSRPKHQVLQNGLAVENNYSTYGYLESVSEMGVDMPIKQHTSQDALGNWTQWQLGNGLTTTATFRQDNGFVDTIQTGSNNVIQNLDYSHDSLGNLLSRRTIRPGENVTESFAYDGVNRLSSSNTTGLGSGSRSVSYVFDKLGNFKTKSDASDPNGYAYGANGAGIHAVTSVTKSGVTRTYDYDNRGNVINSNGKQIHYTAFNKPYSINAGTSQVQFVYSPLRQRIYQSMTNAGSTTQTYYYDGGQFEVAVNEDEVREKAYVAGTLMHTVVRDQNDAWGEIRYLHKDHLGSTDIITDHSGQPITRADGQGASEVRMAFGPYGERRDEGWENPDQAYQDQLLSTVFANTTRGFTGHEHLDSMGLIHMGGRIYDPAIGRFLNPDQFVQEPGFSQSYNRYSYSLNNPLSYSDPSGEIAFLVPAAIAAYKVVSIAWTAVETYETVESIASGEYTQQDAKNKATELLIDSVFGKGSGKVFAKAKKYLGKKPKRNEATSVSNTSEPKASGDGDKRIQKKGDGGRAGVDGDRIADFIVDSNGTNVRNKADFIIYSNGTTVRNNVVGARKDLEAGGFKRLKGKKAREARETKENGTIHVGVPGKDGPMDVRIMDGQAKPGKYKGSRIVTSRSGHPDDLVRSDGSQFKKQERRNQRREEGHTHINIP